MQYINLVMINVNQFVKLIRACSNDCAKKCVTYMRVVDEKIELFFGMKSVTLC